MRRARGDYPEAETLFREALAGYEGLGDEAGIARGARPARDALRRRRRRRPGTAALRATALRCSGGSATLTELRSGSTASPVTRPAGRARRRPRPGRGEPRHPACGRRPPHVRQGALVPRRNQRRPRRRRDGRGAVRGVADALHRVRRSLVLRARARVGAFLAASSGESSERSVFSAPPTRFSRAIGVPLLGTISCASRPGPGRGARHPGGRSLRDRVGRRQAALAR